MEPDLTSGNRPDRREALAKLEQEIADLEAAKALAGTRKARRPINQRLHYLRGIAASVERMRV